MHAQSMEHEAWMAREARSTSLTFNHSQSANRTYSHGDHGHPHLQTKPTVRSSILLYSTEGTDGWRKMPK